MIHTQHDCSSQMNSNLMTNITKLTHYRSLICQSSNFILCSLQITKTEKICCFFVVSLRKLLNSSRFVWKFGTQCCQMRIGLGDAENNDASMDTTASSIMLPPPTHSNRPNRTIIITSTPAARPDGPMVQSENDLPASASPEGATGYTPVDDGNISDAILDSMETTVVYVWTFLSLPIAHHMMTSSNGYIFRVTGHLCGEFTGEFTTQRPVTRSFDVFFDLRLNKRLGKQWWGWWSETISCSLWRHRNDMICMHISVWTILEILTSWGLYKSANILQTNP